MFRAGDWYVITTFWQREGDTHRPRAAEHGPNLHRYCGSGASASRGCHPHDASARAPGLLLNRFRVSVESVTRCALSAAQCLVSQSLHRRAGFTGEAHDQVALLWRKDWQCRGRIESCACATPPTGSGVINRMRSCIHGVGTKRFGVPFSTMSTVPQKLNICRDGPPSGLFAIEGVSNYVCHRDRSPAASAIIW
jgi:hypothetical protein